MTVVLGSTAPSRDAIAALPGVDLHIDAQDMAQLIAQADIGVGGGGVGAWERACLGLPSILLILADNVPILMAHFMVGGVHVDRSAPRGERELHMGEAYAATAQAIPPGPQYVAMGHIHAPQTVPGAPVPAEYAGSLLSLDFGEAGETKRVVIVDAEPGRLAVPESVPLEAGRRLARVTGTWDQIEARADELADMYCDLTVTTTGTDATLAERARETFPFLVKVRAHRPPSAAAERLVKGARGWDELYADYYLREHQEDAPPELIALFREILEEADASA